VEKDIIELIPKTMEKFFGCSGRMVRPSIKTVKAIIRKVDQGKIATLEQLKEKIANDFGVQRTCPATLNKALKELSLQEKPICYWRVVKKNGELISLFPGGVEGQASLLKKEGLEINFKRKNPIVVSFQAKLVETLN